MGAGKELQQSFKVEAQMASIGPPAKLSQSSPGEDFESKESIKSSVI
jgi:hypothetical protein